MRRDGDCLFGRKYFLERPTSTADIFKVHTLADKKYGLHEQI